jgi:O-antigen biosynthesis protein
MKFTGERYIPKDPECEELKFEHESRYFFSSNLVKGKLIADIGCGSGYGCQIISTNQAKKVIGLDISFETLKFAKENFSTDNILYINSSADSLPFSSAIFDIVISFEVIEHLENYKGYLAEIKRILKDDGILILSTPNVVKHLDRKENGEQNFHVHEFCFQDFKSLLSEYFESMAFYSQKYTQSIVLEPFIENKECIDKKKDLELEVENTFTIESPAVFSGDYIIALGKKKGIIETDILTKCKIFNISQTSRIHEMRHHIKKLDEEVAEMRKLADERGDWALGLDDELKEKGEIIRKLRDELDKSNAWAIRISNELKELREKEQQTGLLRKLLKRFI